MAISLKTAGTWARVVADPSSVTIPGTPASGDRMFLFVSWKDYAVTLADPSGWTQIDDFADGTTSAGNGTGSVHNRVYYRDWQSGDGAPSLNWSASPTEAHAVIQLWTKGGGDIWSTPAAVHCAIPVEDPWSEPASSTIDVPSGSVVMSLVGLRDDSSTIARGADDIDDNGSPTVTWNGNYVESPATHFSSTTGLDMSGDLGHRFVTTGASGVTLVTAGDPAASESGACIFVVQGLATTTTLTPDPVAAPSAVPTPTLALSLALSPDPATAPTAVPTPTIALSLALTPDPVASPTAVPPPTVVVDTVVAPDPVAASSAVPTPTISLALEISPDPMAAASAIPTPTIETPLSLSPDAVATATAVPTPSLDLSLSIAPDAAPTATAVPTPTIALSLELSPSPVPAVLAIPTPTIDAGGSPTTTLEPDAVAAPTAVPTPTVDLVLALSPSPVAAVLDVPTPSITVDVVLSPTPVAATLVVVGVSLGGGVPDEVEATIVRRTTTASAGRRRLSGTIDRRRLLLGRAVRRI